MSEITMANLASVIQVIEQAEEAGIQKALTDTPPSEGKPEKPPKLGTFHFTPRKKQQVVKGWGQSKLCFNTVESGLKSCKVERRPGRWFTTHRCATHDVLIIWKSKDGIPWT